MLLFFSVARSASTSQAERANEAQAAASEGAAGSETIAVPGVEDGEEKMPTDKIVDVSPLALRMSSPFNSTYWLSAA